MEAEVSPPSCALIYTHTHLATSFSQDNYLATSASPHSLTHLHAHTLHQLWTLTRNDNRHTHIKTCQGVRVCVYTRTPQALQLWGEKKNGNWLCWWRTQQPAAALQTPQTDRKTDRQRHRQTDRRRLSPTYLAWMIFFFFVALFVCLPEVKSNLHPLPALLIPLSLIIFSQALLH